MMHGPDLEVLKDIPGYKAILKAVLRSQIQLLVCIDLVMKDHYLFYVQNLNSNTCFMLTHVLCLYFL